MKLSCAHLTPATARSKPDLPQRHGACERLSCSVMQQFKNKVFGLDKRLPLDELNVHLAGWLAVRQNQPARTTGENTP